MSEVWRPVDLKSETRDLPAPPKKRWAFRYAICRDGTVWNVDKGRKLMNNCHVATLMGRDRRGRKVQVSLTRLRCVGLAWLRPLPWGVWVARKWEVCWKDPVVAASGRLDPRLLEWRRRGEGYGRRRLGGRPVRKRVGRGWRYFPSVLWAARELGIVARSRAGLGNQWLERELKEAKCEVYPRVIYGRDAYLWAYDGEGWR